VSFRRENVFPASKKRFVVEEKVQVLVRLGQEVAMLVVFFLLGNYAPQAGVTTRDLGELVEGCEDGLAGF
jgi:hypothetical protein